MIETTPRSEARIPSFAYIRHGTRRYPVVARPQCHTCSSKHRPRIERFLIDGLTPRQITDRLPAGRRISAQSIYRHRRRGHLPADHRLVARRREIRAQERWEELGLDATIVEIIEAEKAQGALRRGLDRLTRGQTTLTVPALLNAARHAERHDRANEAEEREERIGAWRIDRIVQDIHRVFEIIGEHCGEQTRNEIFQRAAHDPTTKTILSTSDFDDLREAYLEAEAEERTATSVERRQARRSTGEHPEDRSEAA
jgi:hypothetical protein